MNLTMPVRDLFYVAYLLQRIVKDKTFYSSSRVGIPTPRFVMFYNGTDEEAAQLELKLSDSFLQQVEDPELELKVKVYNINPGKNPELLEHCQRLKEYMIFVGKVRAHAAQMDITAAVECAVDECISEGILADFLSEHRAEAIAMSIYEYDEEKHIKAERQEHYERGKQDGLEEGRRVGHCEEMKKSLSILTQTCQELGLSREESKIKLQEKYDLSPEEAESIVARYWEQDS